MRFATHIALRRAVRLWISLAAASTGAFATAQSVSPVQTPAAANEAPAFHIEADPASSVIGGKIRLELVPGDPAFDPQNIQGVAFAERPDSERWELDADWRKNWGSDDNTPEPWYAQLRPFDLDAGELPDVEVVWLDTQGAEHVATLDAPSISIDKISLEGVKDGDFTDLRGVASAPYDWNRLIIKIVILIVILILQQMIRNWWRRRNGAAGPAAPPEPELPPNEWALREIDRRSKLPGCARGEYGPMYLHASEIVRLYLGRRYGVTAIDMTTKELAGTLFNLDIDDGTLRYVHEFLNECDWVKFTDTLPPGHRKDELWNEARLIVRLTTPDAPPAAQTPQPVPSGGEATA